MKVPNSAHPHRILSYARVVLGAGTAAVPEWCKPVHIEEISSLEAAVVHRFVNEVATIVMLYVEVAIRRLHAPEQALLNLGAARAGTGAGRISIIEDARINFSDVPLVVNVVLLAL
jgi:hypothetical protein